MTERCTVCGQRDGQGHRSDRCAQNRGYVASRDGKLAVPRDLAGHVFARKEAGNSVVFPASGAQPGGARADYPAEVEKIKQWAETEHERLEREKTAAIGSPGI